ncbi:MAG: multiubiquitin [Segetibacter sp.]|nr:multiubiquitin [Segetibacter sp.]
MSQENLQEEKKHQGESLSSPSNPSNSKGTERNEDAPGQNKEFRIFVNTRPKTFLGREITFTQVIELAFGNKVEDGSMIYTVTYSKGEGKKPEGTMDTDEVVKVKNEMIFNATATNKS